MRVRLEKGIKLNRRGILFVVSAVETTHVLLQQLGSTVTQAVLRQDFMEEYRSGDLFFLAKEQPSARTNQAKTLQRSLDDFPEAVRDEVKARQTWVDVYLASEKPSLGQAALTALIEKHAHDLRDQFPKRKTPTASSLRRWVRAFSDSNGQVLALVPRHEKKGAKGKTREQDHIIEAQLNGCLEELWLASHRPSLRSVYRQFRAMLLSQNVEAEEIPSYSTMVRRAERIDYFRRVVKQEGINVARKKARFVGSGAKVTRPMERIQIDSTRLDLFVRDDVTKVTLGRPYLTFAIDEYTKCNVGYFLSLEPPSIESAMGCLYHAILPKTHRDWFALSEHFEWPACGIPEQVVIDNGLEFKNSAMEDAARSLGFDLILSPPYCPWFKGAVERHFRTLNQRAIHNIPGTTKGSVRERGELDPRKSAVLSIEDLKETIERFIVTDYQLALSAGRRQTPLELWKDSAAQTPLALPPSAAQLAIILSRTVTRIAESSGISLFDLRYNSRELHEIVSASGGSLRVKVKFTPSDIRTVFVLSPLTDDYVPVYCMAQEYASLSSISLWEHQGVLRAAKARNKEVTDATLVATKARLERQPAGKRRMSRSHPKKKLATPTKIKQEATLVRAGTPAADIKGAPNGGDSTQGPLRDSEWAESEERFTRTHKKAEELIFGGLPSNKE